MAVTRAGEPEQVTPPATGAPAPAGAAADGAGSDWRAVVVPFALSRLLAVAVLVVTGRVVTHHWAWEPLYYWDGPWYIRIAMHGYGGPLPHDVQGPWPFFPLLPGIGRASEDLGLDMWIGMVLVNHLALFGALVGVRRLGRLHGFTTAQCRFAVWLIAFFPASAVFSMVYPSSLFLLGSVWAFVLVRQGRLGWAGLAATITVMVRPNGVLLLPALALAAAAPLQVARWRAALVAVVRACWLPTLAFAVWLVELHRWSGDALVFYRAKVAWDETRIDEFVTGPDKYEIPHVALGVLGIAVVVWAIRRLPPAWVLYSALFLLVPLLTGVVGLARYTNETFPVAFAAGLAGTRLLPRHPGRLLAVTAVAGAAGMVFITSAYIRLAMVP